jgi:PAS domain S-box-containing protein
LFGSLYVYYGSIETASFWANQLFAGSRFFMALCFLVVIGLLIYSYRNATTAGVRSKIRIVVLGGVISLLPLLILGILPNALLGETILPQAILFLFLGVLPLTYGFAIFRYRLIEIERHVNRGATIILVYSVLGVVYLLFSVGLDQLLPEISFKGPVINTLLVLTLATVFSPLNRFVQRLVDTIFYGGWYDYRSAVSVITQGLEQITELYKLAESVCSRVVNTLRLEEACVFLTDLEGDFSVIAVSPTPRSMDSKRSTYAPLPRSSLSYLLNVGAAVERSVLREALSQASLSPAEVDLLNSEQAYLWVPIIGHGNVLGLMALGPKLGGDIFGGEDTDILRVVARGVAPLIENIHLVTRLRQHNAMLEQRVMERTEELSESKKRLEAILSSVGEGVVVTDLDGTLLTVNATYEKQTGYSVNELTGNKMWDHYDLEDPVAFQNEIQTVTQQGYVWSRETVGLKKDESHYDVQITMAPLRDEYGRVIGYVGSQRDITHHKELDRLKDLFVSDVSHELRTPTTNISLYLDLMENAHPDKRAHYLEVLKDQSSLLMKLVEDILDLSRLAVQKDKRLEFIPINLNELTEQVVTAIRPMAEATGLQLEYEPAVEPLYIHGEPNQISRLVTNLVANAIHYTPRGKVSVQTKSSNGLIYLDVSDTGIGIDLEDQQHIFERFYRGRLVRQSKIHGTGLGLAIVKEIADMHDCKIEVQSETGKGSKFTVRFPALIGEEWLEKRSLL